MTPQEYAIQSALFLWIREMEKSPSMLSRFSRKMQLRINRAIPEKIHQAITTAIRQTTKAVIFGASFTASQPFLNMPFQTREEMAKIKIKNYSNTAAAEGALTGAGGILLGLTDFPLWLSLKMKMLFDIASIYGYDTAQYKERVFLLYIFELTFSNQEHRSETFRSIKNWEAHQQTLPEDINAFNWRSFQQEYRDFIDIAKLLQLIPGIGAPVGAVVNHRLTHALGKNAMNAYRLRWFLSNGNKV